jgi:DHA1 family multidrug resistance protein-like MFS transporter
MTLITRRNGLVQVVAYDSLHHIIASSAPSSAVLVIPRELHVRMYVGDLILTLFFVGYMLGSTFWDPGSELIGTLTIYILFHIDQARANDMTTLLVTASSAGSLPLHRCQ